MPQITDVEEVMIGHATDRVGATGCTVVLCGSGAVAGVDVRGGAPGTRETDLLHPSAMMDRIHAVLLAGGSAFGLAAADGVMRFLEEHGIGFDIGVARVPIVPAAALFDLALGDAGVRPGAEMGYRASEAAARGPVEEGSVGAGTGATVGKVLGPLSAMKGGVGTWSITLPGGVIVGALVVVNSFGDVRDDHTGRILAGARDPATGDLIDSVRAVLTLEEPIGFGHTSLGVVATNARLTKAEATRLAQLAHDGLARTIWPVHTQYDGDTIFALSCGTAAADLLQLGVAAVEAVAMSVKRGVLTAKGLHGIPGLADNR
ncbi:MAG TPA: P1 family peptidase [bacterium]|jgi:L-aminopeptidase/D-esterase-like protein